MTSFTVVDFIGTEIFVYNITRVRIDKGRESKFAQYAVPTLTDFRLKSKAIGKYQISRNRSE